MEQQEEQVDLELSEPQGAENDRQNNRNQILANKVKAEAEARAKAEADAAQAAKERDFFKSFNSLAAKHPGASEFQDQIFERVVNKGYDPEEATLAVLAKEGRLNAQPQPEAAAPAPVIDRQPQASPAGGSASTNVTQSGGRRAEDMTLDEQRAELVEAERRGDLGFR